MGKVLSANRVISRAISIEQISRSARGYMPGLTN
jgi:hypothetical protein